ncbi:hypothetical protein [Streptomyces sp. NPDC005859]|uniref:hypothetical protein n=1 Tax=Streptomyces sp. NPDC005859 TaxID=3157170 RepID=UPI0033F98B40
MELGQENTRPSPGQAGRRRRTPAPGPLRFAGADDGSHARTLHVMDLCRTLVRVTTGAEPLRT